jgi:hypothetical protein
VAAASLALVGLLWQQAVHAQRMAADQAALAQARVAEAQAKLAEGQAREHEMPKQ